VCGYTIRMAKMRIGVLRGGPSSEYDISLKTGGHVLRNLSEEKYHPQDIFISKSGVWHVRGLETPLERALKGLDVVFNALHGEYGEDGTIQRVLETHGVPYTGSGALASARAMNKVLAKEAVRRLGIRTPHHVIMERSNEDLKRRVFDLFRSSPQPSIIKPIGKGSSIGVIFAGSFEELLSAIEEALRESPQVLVEEFIRGREATCGVVEGLRGERHYALFPIEIKLPKGKQIFDYDAKYVSGCDTHCPGHFTTEEKQQLEGATRAVHEVLGLRHYSRSDFIVTPRGVYFLEVNTLPGLAENSLVPRALKEAGYTFPEFLDHVISLAVNGK